MAEVPEYGVRRQTLRPVQTHKIDSRATPDVFGAQVGRSMQSLAAGIGQVGDAFAAVKELEDKAVVEDRVNQYSDFARTRTYDPEKGYANQLGQNAVTGRQQFETDLEERRTELGQNLTPAQQRLYDRATQARRRQALDTGIKHASQQRRKWFDDAATARLETFADDALAMSDEPEKLQVNLAAAQREIADRGALQGWAPEQTTVAQQEFLSGVHKNIVLKHAIEDPMRAKEWLDANRGIMTEAHQLELDRALDGPVMQVRAQLEAERIIQGGERPVQRANSLGSIDMRVRTSNNSVDFEGLQPDTKTAFGRLQSALGQQLLVTSAYRSPKANAAAGGATKSQHIQGTAIDIDIRGMSRAERLDLIAKAFDAGFTGIGVGTNILHVDQGKPRAWGYATSSGGAPVPAYAAELINERLAGLRGGSRQQRTLMLDAMERVEGFKPGTSNGGEIPGFVGPQYVMNQVAHITDPRMRAQTAVQLTRMYNAQDAAERRAQRQGKLAAERWIIQNPGTDPTKLPLNIQMQLGIDGMNTLWSYNDRIAQAGAVETDERLYAELQRLQAEDPYAFAEDVDLFDYMDRLSTKDRRGLQQLQADAIKDRREGSEEALTQAKSISTAVSIADARLEAAGVQKTGKAATEESMRREAQFQRALVDRMREFQQQNSRVPNDYEVSDMVDQLLLPIIVKEPGMLWGTNDEEAFVFEAPFRADNATAEINMSYDQIPIDVRLAIREELAKELGREPTEDEVKKDYVEFVLTGK